MCVCVLLALFMAVVNQGSFMQFSCSEVLAWETVSGNIENILKMGVGGGGPLHGKKRPLKLAQLLQ